MRERDLIESPELLFFFFFFFGVLIAWGNIPRAKSLCNCDCPTPVQSGGEGAILDTISSGKSNEKVGAGLVPRAQAKDQ
jgi:hypothetical protein